MPRSSSKCRPAATMAAVEVCAGAGIRPPVHETAVILLRTTRRLTIVALRRLSIVALRYAWEARYADSQGSAPDRFGHRQQLPRRRRGRRDDHRRGTAPLLEAAEQRARPAWLDPQRRAGTNPYARRHRPHRLRPPV